MLNHVVLFWLKPTLSDAEREAFAAGLQTLTKIESADRVEIGTPASTPARPVIDGSYDFGLNVLLPDLPSHDAYQADPLHKAFLENHKEKWDRALIYDFD